ncbi:hypothetical protein Hanom_Chr04g00371261 [Helianthus anomalus]
MSGSCGLDNDSNRSKSDGLKQNTFCPKLDIYFQKSKMRFLSLSSFATSVQRFVFLHLDPKGLKSCHFHMPR